MNELLIYGGVSFAFAAGWASRAMTAQPLGDPDWRTVAGQNFRKFVEACKEANALQDRLDRIVEAFADQKSGTAQKAVKLALGDQ